MKEWKRKWKLLQYNGYYKRILWGLGFRNGNENGNYHNGLYKDYYKDPFLHS